LYVTKLTQFLIYTGAAWAQTTSRHQDDLQDLCRSGEIKVVCMVQGTGEAVLIQVEDWVSQTAMVSWARCYGSLLAGDWLSIVTKAHIIGVGLHQYSCRVAESRC